MVVKINISLPEEVLRRIDLAARESRATRSAFLLRAAEHLLAVQAEERRQQRRREASERILKLADELGPWDGTAEVLKWRDRH